MESKIISRKEAAEILGVSAQSISNYIKRGLLRKAGNEASNICFVYLEEVKALAGKAQNIEKMELNISAYEKILSDKEKDLKQEVDMFYKEKGVWKYYARYDFKRAILGCAAIAGVSGRTFDILSEFLSGTSFEKIGELYRLSAERIRQILCKSIRALNYRPEQYSCMREENSELRKKIRMLQCECDELRAEVKRIKTGKKSPSNEAKGTESDFIPWKGIDLSTKLVDLDISIRAKNVLKTTEIENLYELVRFKKNDLFKFRWFGRRIIRELDEMLERLNLYFGIPVKIVDGQFVLCKEKKGGNSEN